MWKKVLNKVYMEKNKILWSYMEGKNKQTTEYPRPSNIRVATYFKTDNVSDSQF